VAREGAKGARLLPPMAPRVLLLLRLRPLLLLRPPLLTLPDALTPCQRHPMS